MMDHVVVTVTQVGSNGNVSSVMIQNLDDQTLWASNEVKENEHPRLVRNAISLLATYLEEEVKRNIPKNQKNLNLIGQKLWQTEGQMDKKIKKYAKTDL